MPHPRRQSARPEMDSLPSQALSSPPPSKARRWAWRIAQFLITAAAFGYLFSRVSLASLGDAISRIPLLVEVEVLALVLAGVLFGAWRWQVLLAACGAVRMPRWWRLLRLSFVGMFYNQYVPGSVGGDIVRGVATQDAFDESGLPRALAVTLLDRIMGFAGLLSIAGFAFVVRPLPGLKDFGMWVGIGAGGVALGIVMVTQSARFAHWLPGPVGRLVASLPHVRSIWALVLAWLLSFGTHGTLVVCGYALVGALEPKLRLVDALAVMPVSNLAAYFPLSVGGAGAWEWALVELFALVASCLNNIASTQSGQADSEEAAGERRLVAEFHRFSNVLRPSPVAAPHAVAVVPHCGVIDPGL